MKRVGALLLRRRRVGLAVDSAQALAGRVDVEIVPVEMALIVLVRRQMLFAAVLRCRCLEGIFQAVRQPGAVPEPSRGS